ncbi:MAG: F0F1 ATP synthase subunit A [Deltaproteobacteria bacterium]|nr:F0F1 ATP synthase subunit A [Deltaproteobacteria bacterium]
MDHGTTSWLLMLPLLPHDPKYLHVNGAVVVFLIIAVLSVLAKFAIESKVQQYVVPQSRFSLVTFIDFVVEMLHNLVVGILGHHGEKHFPFIASVFMFVFVSNLLGLLPFGGSPSTSVNTTFALGLCSFIYYHASGVKEHGLLGYGKHFLMGLGIFGLPIALLEMVSHVIRPFSLGLRLFVNLFIDHSLVSSFENVCRWLVPVPLLLFGIMVCTIQAFLFTILTSVYIQMATEHE